MNQSHEVVVVRIDNVKKQSFIPIPTNMSRPFKPASLQGNLHKKNYFEGWFQKIYAPEHQLSFIIIYGFANGHHSDEKGFIQLHIPHHEHLLLKFPEKEVVCATNQHRISFRKNVLSTKTICIETDEVKINLSISQRQTNTTFKNTMGTYYLIPNLPCYHAVVDQSHQISGEIHCSGATYSINNARGYLEKNWGKSFPEKYIWLHAFDPENSDTQLLFSQAEIQWMGKTYTKHIGYITFDGIHVDLLQLKNCQIRVQPISETVQRIFISSPTLNMDIAVALGSAVLFKAPKKGLLHRSIAHYNDVAIHVRLLNRSQTRTFDLIGNFENVGM